MERKGGENEVEKKHKIFLSGLIRAARQSRPNEKLREKTFGEHRAVEFIRHERREKEMD